MRTGAPSILLSTVGNDTAGDTIKQQMASLGMDTSLIKTVPSQSTAVSILYIIFSLFFL